MTAPDHMPSTFKIPLHQRGHPHMTLGTRKGIPLWVGSCHSSHLPERVGRAITRRPFTSQMHQKRPTTRARELPLSLSPDLRLGP